MHATHDKGSLTDRDIGFLATDIAAVRGIAQAAVDVELFTIPLYMTSLYSLVGMHPITGQGNDYYKGRLWPGGKTGRVDESDRSRPGWANQRAFNIVFSVFVQEMLHLQMAANLATAIGAQPTFTDTKLQDARHGWTCYGPQQTVIPGIVDLRDTRDYADVAVDIGPLDRKSIELFLAIEEPQEQAERDIVRHEDRYFPKVPFQSHEPDKLFGSIGHLYGCYRDYLLIRYSNGTTLWENVFDPLSQQNDMFNSAVTNHSQREFPGFHAIIASTDSAVALEQALTMMNAITDQGEGATLKVRLAAKRDAAPLTDVRECYRSDRTALEVDYPSFTDAGAQVASNDAIARFDNDAEDHYERFQEIRRLLDEGDAIQTWADAGKSGRWAASDLTSAEFVPDPASKLPTPEQIAGALNRLCDDDADGANYRTMSQAVVGAIKGVTTVLDLYWNRATAAAGFPYPSMVGSGDRMAAAWAVFGRTPDLAQGIDDPDTAQVGHACQGLSLAEAGTNCCAQTDVFHSCKGSNVCKGMAGCGFVHTVPTASGGGGGGGGCSAVQVRVKAGICGAPPTPPPPSAGPLYTAPSDNICASFGGCAIPISACQVYPTQGTMAVMNLVDGTGSQQIDTIGFAKGDRVEDVAFAAFAAVARHRGIAVPPRQEPSDIRLAFPPST